MTTLRHDLVYRLLPSPVGTLLLAGDDEALHLVGFPGGSRQREPRTGWRRHATAFKDICAQLRGYFAGELRQFDIPLCLDGTRFQMAVWSALRDIPFGETVSYGAVAASVGMPTAGRAVGAANGANPIPIIVPCHRVIGSNGSLTGFGGGIEVKSFLLKHERAKGFQGGLF